MMMGETAEAETTDVGEDPADLADLADLAVEHLTRERRLARGLRVAARRAVVLARRYRREEGPRGQREMACVTQALAWRSQARELRNGSSAFSDRPGIARAAGSGSEPRARNEKERASSPPPSTGDRRAG